MPGNAKDTQIMVVGDVHGVWSSLNRLINRKRPRMILQCGDFGYYPREKRPIMQRTNLGSERCAGIEYPFDPNTRVNNLVDGKRVPIHWCDGNHEDHEQLRWNIEFGKSEVAPGVHYQPRGSTLTLPDGRTVLFAGGAKSVDWKMRKEGEDWFTGEVLTEDDLSNFPDPSESQIDIVISHTAPASLQDIQREMIYHPLWDMSPDLSREVLDIVWERYRPSQWFFGHFHTYCRQEQNGTSFTALNHEAASYWWVWL